MSKENTTATVSGKYETPSPFVPVSEIPEEQLPMVHISKERRDALEVCGTKRAKGSPGNIDNHIRGIKGEFVVAKYYGDPDQVDTEMRKYGDGGVDLEILGRVQVKTCRPRVNNPRLLVGARKRIRADTYILVQELDRSTYRIIGCAPRQVVVEAPVSRFRLDGYAKQLRVVEQDNLWQPPQPAYSKDSL